MSAIKTWSTTAAANDSPAPDGFPENMAPSGVNDSAREVMAAVASWYRDAEWRDLGHAVAYAGAASFTVAGDLTAVYTPGRRLRCADATTLYGTVVASSYGSPNTTVTVALDGGALSAGLSAVALGPLAGPASAEPWLNPTRPAFLAHNSAGDSNVTGDGTTVTVDFDTEVFDQGGNFADDTFTAPVAGKYQLNMNVTLDQMTAGPSTLITYRIVTSNRTFVGFRSPAGASEAVSLSILADMDVGDTASVTVTVTGMAGNTARVSGGADARTSFSGFLVNA